MFRSLCEQLTNLGYEQSVCARVRGVALHEFKIALYVLVCIAAYLWCENNIKSNE